MKICLALALCLCLLLCGCGPKVYVDDPPYTGTFPTTGHEGKTDEQWNEIMSYADYLALPAAERGAFVDSFENQDDFKAWLKAVQRIYEKEQQSDKVGEDGVIDMDKINP